VILEKVNPLGNSNRAGENAVMKRITQKQEKRIVAFFIFVVLVQEALANRRAAKARNAICRADLALELVVISKFLVCVSLMSVK
jgi:hypothetical protein